jgi:acyl-CoA thioester hydrolase
LHLATEYKWPRTEFPLAPEISRRAFAVNESASFKSNQYVELHERASPSEPGQLRNAIIFPFCSLWQRFRLVYAQACGFSDIPDREGTMTERKDFWFFYPDCIRDAEVDEQGIVRKYPYVAYFNTAIRAYMHALGYPGRVAFDMLAALLNPKTPIHFDDVIEIGVRAVKIDRSCITFSLALFPRHEDKLLATGDALWVCVNEDDDSPRPFPLGLLELIEAKEGLASAS